MFTTNFTGYDCYESFSYPKEYLELFHHHKRGPFYLYVTFMHEIYSFIYGYIKKGIFRHNTFMRIHGRCSNTTIITTERLPIINMTITIMIYPYKYERKISKIIYIFKMGFNTGDYILRGMNRNVGIKAKVLTDRLEYMIKYKILKTEEKIFLNSLSDSEGDICVITDNNPDAVIRPTYTKSKSNGLLTSITVRRTGNDYSINEIVFSAYGCISGDINPNEFLVFIDDHLNLTFRFTSIFLKDDLSMNTYAEIPFNISNIKFVDINQHKNLPCYLKKIFLIEDWRNLKRWVGGNCFAYISYKGNEYYVKKQIKTNISLYVIEYSWIPSIPPSLC